MVASSPVIHCNDAAAFWHTRVGAALAGAGVVYNVRDTMDPEAFTGLRRLKWRLKFAIAHEVVVLSSEMKDFYVRHLRLSPAAARRIVAIPSIVEHLPLATAPVRRRLRDEFGLSPDVFAFGYVATFSPKKGQLEFLSKAAPVLKAGEGKVRCIFIGDFDVDNNAYARRCQQLIEGMGLQQVVECRGSTSRMADWYCALDGVVLASRYEGLARCMIEGMAAGLPVVSFDVCSARETLEASSAGVVVEQGDFERLAQELLRLAEDPKTAFAMGQAGLAYARRVFEADAVAEAYRQVYARTAGRQAA